MIARKKLANKRELAENWGACYSENVFNADLQELELRLSALTDEQPKSSAQERVEQMAELCQKFKHPERACPVFHITGSKGKGSTAGFIASILEQAGYKVGRLSSPYVIHFTERFQCGNEYFAKEEYLRALEELEKGLQRLKIERLPHSVLMPLYAFLLFRTSQCDFMVIEVGMGGKSDPTNVVSPLASVITRIELEHQKYLGETLAEIAEEKAGIIKPGVPVLVIEQTDEVVKILRDRAGRVGSDFQLVKPSTEITKTDSFFADSYDEFTGCLTLRIETRDLSFDLRMPGVVQAENALLAAAAVNKAVPGIKCETIEAGLQAVMLPGRFDVRRNIIGYDGIPYLIIDGAHTVSSVAGCVETFHRMRALEGVKNAQDSCLTDFLPGPEPLLLFSTADDKPVTKIADLLGSDFRQVILTKLEHKKVDQAKLMQAFSKNFDSKWIEQPEEAARDALETANREQRPLVVLGSMYLAGVVYRELERKCQQFNELFD